MHLLLLCFSLIGILLKLYPIYHPMKNSFSNHLNTTFVECLCVCAILYSYHIINTNLVFDQLHVSFWVIALINMGINILIHLDVSMYPDMSGFRNLFFHLLKKNDRLCNHQLLKTLLHLPPSFYLSTFLCVIHPIIYLHLLCLRRGFLKNLNLIFRILLFL